jgi:hypothetical protein
MSIRAFVFGTSLLLAAAPASAQQFNAWMDQRAPYWGDSRAPQYDSRYDSRRIAYDNGYREGMRDGESAARDRRAFDVGREKDYRKADKGYSRSYGDKDRYRDTFRSGYRDGYRAAYDRYGYNGGYYGDRGGGVRRDGGYGYPGRYPNQYPSYPGGGYGYGTDIAFQNGVNDGYQKGLDDVRDRKYSDYARQKWYRDGDRHYEGRYGSRDAYKAQYRRGFQQGYERAYREGRRY